MRSFMTGMIATGLLLLVWTVLSCGHTSLEQPLNMDTQLGYKITGIAGESLFKPSPRTVVDLTDKTTGLIIQEAETDLSGRFYFKNLPPGNYVVSTGDVRKEVKLVNQDQNVFLKIVACECCPKY